MHTRSWLLACLSLFSCTRNSPAPDLSPSAIDLRVRVTADQASRISLSPSMTWPISSGVTLPIRLPILSTARVRI